MLNSLLILFAILSLNEGTSAEFLDDIRIDCSDVKGNLLGKIVLENTNPEPAVSGSTNFQLVTRKRRNPTQLDKDSVDEDTLAARHFDPTLETVLISHGYRSSWQSPWVTELAQAILDIEDRNIILIDWDAESNHVNYVHSVNATPYVADDIRNFLHSVRLVYENDKNRNSHNFHSLYCIGHSLGAHICGQAAYALRESDGDVYRVKRISALDPAQPCFKYSAGHVRVEKSDAEFVDVVHTQASEHNSELELTFGFHDPIGHVDFYVNGGVFQAHCEAIGFASGMPMTERMCSHSMVHDYFIESVKNAKNGDSCKFVGWPWDRTLQQAEEILTEVERHEHCRDCPEMGIRCSKNQGSGPYIVITGRDPPYCRFQRQDADKVLEDIQAIDEGKSRWLQQTESLFEKYGGDVFNKIKSIHF